MDTLPLDKKAGTEHTSGLSLFQQDWWLRAAADGADERVRIERVRIERDGVVAAELPFHLERRRGLRYITNPPYARAVDPVLKTPPAAAARRLSAQVQLLEALLDALPAHDRFDLWLSPGSDLALPFAACGHTVSNQFTFAWDGRNDVRELWRSLKDTTRNGVKTAATRLAVDRHADVERFSRLSLVQREHRRNSNDFAAIARIFEACAGRGQGTILSAVDERGRDVAVAVLIWGCGRLYYWLSARDPDRAGTGANSLLLWRAIELSHELGLIFDADSHNVRQSLLFLSRFGLAPLPRPMVSRSGRLWTLACLAKSLVLPA